jgi:hypothetical protein
MLVAPSQRAASAIKASFLFAAALCETSGSFLIFASRCASGTTLNGLRLSLAPWPVYFEDEPDRRFSAAKQQKRGTAD